jgi:hypothetical protein
MTSNEQFESELRGRLAGFKHSGSLDDIRALATTVEKYLDYCAREYSRWRDARLKVENELDAFIGANLPREQQQKVLNILLDPIREKTAEVEDLSRRLKQFLGEIQAEVAASPA